MGSLTENYNLYKPDIGETDWGEEVNQNWNIIDNVLKEHEDEIEELKKKCATFILIEAVKLSSIWRVYTLYFYKPSIIGITYEIR